MTATPAYRLRSLTHGEDGPHAVIDAPRGPLYLHADERGRLLLAEVVPGERVTLDAVTIRSGFARFNITDEAGLLGADDDAFARTTAGESGDAPGRAWAAYARESIEGAHVAGALPDFARAVLAHIAAR